jgi:hypothetical protein
VFFFKFCIFQRVQPRARRDGADRRPEGPLEGGPVLHPADSLGPGPRRALPDRRPASRRLLGQAAGRKLHTNRWTGKNSPSNLIDSIGNFLERLCYFEVFCRVSGCIKFLI